MNKHPFSFLLGIVFAGFLSSCDDRSDIWGTLNYKTSNVTIQENSNIFSYHCEQINDVVVSISDNEGELFYKDTLVDLAYLLALNCQLNTYQGYENFFDTTICRSPNCLADSLMSLEIFKNAILKFQDVSKVNYMIEHKFKIRAIPVDSYELDCLYNLLINTQFHPKTPESYFIYNNSQNDWLKILRKYSLDNLNDIRDMRRLNTIEYYAFEETMNTLEGSNKNDLYLCFIKKYDGKWWDLELNDFIVRYSFMINERGYLQLKKRLMNPSMLIVSRRYE